MHQTPPTRPPPAQINNNNNNNNDNNNNNNNNNNKFKCPDCSRTFGQSNNLHRHRRAVHGTDLAEEIKERKQKKKEATLKRRREEKAEQVKKRDEKRKKSQPRPFNIDEDLNVGELHCRHPNCKQIFVNDMQRDQHEKSHSQPKMFSCNECRRQFTRFANKENHERNCRSRIRPARPNAAEDDVNENDSTEFTEISSAFDGASRMLRLDFAPGIKNLEPRLQNAIDIATDQLAKLQLKGNGLKYFVSLHANFYKVTEPEKITCPPVVFNSGSCVLLPAHDTEIQTQIIHRNFLNKIEEYRRNGSDWQLWNLVSLDIGAVRYDPVNGSSWLELPESIAATQACVNVQNDDQKCLVWAIRSALDNIPDNPQNVQH